MHRRTLLASSILTSSALVTVLCLSTVIPPPIQASVSPPIDANDVASTALNPFANDSGVIQTVSTTGPLDPLNPFFQPIGTNGRACVTCHQPGDGWSVRPDHLRARFDATHGLDPIFRTNDGSNSPNADVSTVGARRRAYSMLLSKGLIRVGLAIPATADFSLVAVDDPYHYASASELSMFRRPLPSTNLPFLTTVMWDGRESPKGRSINDDLTQQAIDATAGHAQGAVTPSAQQLADIVALETHIYTAQIFDYRVGFLNDDGALGGPVHLSTTPFYFGINDVLGGDPNGIPFNSSAMTLYDAWSNAGAHSDRPDVARGEVLFNTKPISITGVAGLNDALGHPVIAGTCTTCHDTPNVGDHSLPLPINIGVADASRRTPDLPLYTLKNNATGETVQTTDPGRALITGKYADIGKFKGPILRGLASRAPYFHNGSAADLDAVVGFYDTRFGVGFTKQEKHDLVAFLRTL